MGTCRTSGGAMATVSAPATILNVDDDEAGRYATSRVLRRAGFRVLEAANGGQALRLLAEARGLPAERAGRRLPLGAPDPVAEAVRGRRPVAREAEGGGTLVALPMVVHGRAVGGLLFGFPAGHAPDRQGHALLDTLAGLCGQ